MHVRSTALAAGLALLLSACSAERPVLYPNDQYNRVGEGAASREIDDCIRLSKEYNAGSGASEAKAREAARNSTVGAVSGGAIGAVGGAIGGNAGEGAAIGAATGATAGLMSTIFGGLYTSEPDPVYRNFVERCLRERGYEPIGWR